MICRKCGAKMNLDDREYNFKGNYNNYWYCEKCNIGCTEEVRFAQSFKETWFNEDGIVDFEIKHQINRDKAKR